MMPGQQPENINQSENLPIELCFGLSRGDLFWYNFRYARYLGLSFVFFAVFFFIALVLMIKTPPGDLWTTYMWVAIGAGIGLSMSAGGIGAIALQVFVLKNETINKAMELRNYRIGKEGIEIFTSRHSLMRSWDEIVKIDIAKSGYYFRTSGKLAIIIPKRILDSEVKSQALDELLRNLGRD